MLQRDRQRQRERGTAGGGGAGALTAEYLVVAGGGGGGSNSGGGGGAGGYRSSVTGESSGGGASAESALSIALGTPYAVKVGAGGATSGGASNSGNKGSDSIFGIITSEGGGKGGGTAAVGGNGGSGGGGGGGISPKSGGAGTANQGFDGAGLETNGGGGGGAGAAGLVYDGGNGVLSSITGLAVTRGGGGGSRGGTTGGVGGDGGGGNGSGDSPGIPQNGTANTGGGGGGCRLNQNSGTGGSGVVIIRVPSTVVAEFSAGVVYNYIPLDDFNVYEITAAGVSDTVTFSQGAVTTVGESLRFNDDDSAYLTRTPASAGDRKTWTWSGWVKRGNLVDNVVFQAGSGLNFSQLVFNSNNLLYIEYLTAGGQSGAQTSAVFRDPSAWYHLIVAVDTTQSLDSERLKIYINGTVQPYITRSGYPRSAPALNYSSQVNNTILHQIGRSTSTFDGYLSDVYFIDGEALDPSRFGKQDADGIWQPITYTGSYGTNGFHLDFADNSTAAALGTDTSGNGNDWTPSGITTDDQVTDTPSVNYCTWNPLDLVAQTLSDGNLAVTYSANAAGVNATFAVSSGKWYWEWTAGDDTDVVGIWSSDSRCTSYPGTTIDSYGYFGRNADLYNNGSPTNYGSTFGLNDVIGVALDLDAGTLTFYKNNVSQGVAVSGLSGGWRPSVRAGNATNPSTGYANFGQRPFAYTPPTGFQALNSSNLPAPTITDGKAHFQPALYTGNGTTQAIGGLEFQPDFVWIKDRNIAYDHQLLDAIRGATNELESNTPLAEFTNVDGLTAFNANGFTVGADLKYNRAGDTYVAWNWNAGGSTVANTDGSIPSQVRANTDAGFSIVSYTGTGAAATVGHGLTTAPAFIIAKNRDSATNWAVYSDELSISGYLLLNLTNAVATSTSVWQAARPTSSVFSVKTSNLTNGSTHNIIAYCFAEVDGFSKFGSYTGNGSADGPFVYTGFRPAFVMVKPSSRTGRWRIKDTSRDVYNVMKKRLDASSSDAEATGSTEYIDFTSNGFKIRTTEAQFNGSGETIIYMAFAENPFKTARAR